MSLTLEFSQKEVELLVDILEDRLGTLREQVYHADTPDFRDGLKAEEVLLRSLLDRAKHAEPRFTPSAAAL